MHQIKITKVQLTISHDWQQKVSIISVWTESLANSNSMCHIQKVSNSIWTDKRTNTRSVNPVFPRLKDHAFS